MKLKLFIDRPILACVVSVLILLVGLIGLVNLPMEQYPCRDHTEICRRPP